MADQITISKTLSIRDCGYDENWLQEKIATDPSILRNGRIVAIEFGNVPGKRPLEGQKMNDFETVVRAKAEEIVERWINFFVRNVRSKPEIINRRIK